MTKTACYLVVTLLIPGSLLAADARDLFQSGSTALVVGKADEAVKDFEAAYALSPSPSLLFYMAEAHRVAGHKAKAVRFYEQYLDEAPTGRNAAEAKQRFAELKLSDKKPARKGKKVRKLALTEIELSQPARLTLPAAPAVKPAETKPAELALATPQPAPVTTLPLPAPAPAPAAPSVILVVAAPAPAAAPAVAVASPPAAVPAVAPATPPVAQPAAFMSPGAPANMGHTGAGAPPTGGMASVSSYSGKRFVTYTARLMGIQGKTMGNYATTMLGSTAGLYTHGIAFGVQNEEFKQAAYVGFGTQIGGPNETLQRYELSYQFAWAPLGPESIVSPRVGFRAGGMMATSQALTGGSMKAGLVVAPEVGIDLNATRNITISAGVGYDANLGPDLGKDASLSGYALNGGASIRF